MGTLLSEMIVDIDVQLIMDDGVVLSADVFRPAGDGDFPVLMSYGPYGKALHFEDGYPDQWRKMVSDHPDTRDGSTNRYQSWEYPDPEKWVPAGYALVRIDSRGAGRSEGRIDPWSPRETQDYYDCIEWAAEQPWSNGKIGLTGVSYYASNQWQVAALRPPHLAAICPWEGASDIYREIVRHGGVLCAFLDGWYKAQVESVQHGLADKAAKSRIDGRSVVGDDRLTDQELVRNRIDFSGEIRRHPFDDEFWRGRTAKLEDIEVPVLSAANWGGPPHLRGNVEGFMRVGSTLKWLEFHGLEHWTHYYTDYGVHLQRQFFDHFLKDEDNGWSARPPIILNARNADGSFEHRSEASWPLPQTNWTTLYLAREGHLVPKVPDAAPPMTYRAMDEEVTFSLRVEQTCEFTGPAKAKLYISSTTTDADLFIILRLFDPEGQEVTFRGVVDPAMPVGFGWLRASRRKMDPVRSTEVRPYHTHDEEQPLIPGEIYELDIEIWPTSVIVPKGFTFGVTIQGHDYDHGPIEGNDVGWMPNMTGVGPFRHMDSVDRNRDLYAGQVTIYSSAEYPSHVILPAIAN